ncbi:MAG: BrnT family toxin [Azoarcus sp.]|jgi:uncharacterized DUF497 family protein|nr:BrnT family toxin [Azoarcus sp.]
MKVRFEWDEAKAAINFKKHGVRFETAVRAFADPFLLSNQDRIEHGERRWQSLGLVDGFLLLVIAHTVREDTDEVIRIISARRADRKERCLYETLRR